MHAQAALPDCVAFYPRVSKRRSNRGLKEAVGLGSPSYLSSKEWRIVKEAGSGRDGHRRGLVGQVSHSKVGAIQVE